MEREKTVRTDRCDHGLNFEFMPSRASFTPTTPPHHPPLMEDDIVLLEEDIPVTRSPLKHKVRVLGDVTNVFNNRYVFQAYISLNITVASITSYRLQHDFIAQLFILQIVSLDKYLTINIT
jgi:hypothetical protein